MSDAYNPWDSFSQGAEIGGRIRRVRQQTEVGRSYASGGPDAAAATAGAQGDLETVQNADQISQGRRRFQDQEHQQVFETLDAASKWVLPVLGRVEQLPVDQRAAFLNSPHIRQRFEALKFTPEQIDNAISHLSNPETSEEMLGSLRSAFTQHQDPNWSIRGNQVVGVDQQTGAVTQGGTVPENPDWQNNGTTPYYIDSQGAVHQGSGQIPRVGRQGAGADPSLPPGFQWEE